MKVLVNLKDPNWLEPVLVGRDTPDPTFPNVLDLMLTLLVLGETHRKHVDVELGMQGYLVVN